MESCLDRILRRNVTNPYNNRHVAKTGDIKRFVILEDTALAKGIRRIVGVTGDEALKAQRAADEWEQKINDLKNLENSALENSLKVVGKDLSSCVIPTVRKSRLREVFDGIKKNFDDQDKIRKAREGKEAAEAVKLYFEENPSAAYYVAVINRNGNVKALGSAINQLRGTDRAAFLISVDEIAGKINHQCIIPKNLIEKGFKATDWAQVVVDKIGGRKGGSEGACQGAGTEVDQLDTALDLAQAFASKMTL